MSPKFLHIIQNDPKVPPGNLLLHNEVMALHAHRLFQ